MLFVSANERVTRYLRRKPFPFLLFLRFIVFIDIFLRRVLRGELVFALLPSSILYVILYGDHEIALALYNGNVTPVLVLFDMYDGQTLFRFRPVLFFLHFFSFFFFLQYFATHRQKLVRLDSDISILSICAVLLELFHFREDRLILIDRLAEYRKKPAAALVQHICPVPAPVGRVLFVDERIIDFLFRLLLLFFRHLLRRFLCLPYTVDEPVQNGGMRADYKLTPVIALLCNCNGFCPFLRFGGIPPVPIVFLHGIRKHIFHPIHAELFDELIFKAFVQVHTVKIVSDRLLYLVLALDIRLQRLSVQIFLAV